MLLVDSLPTLESLLEMVLGPAVPSGVPSGAPSGAGSEARETRGGSKGLPWLHSQTLPLIHVTADETRLFIPVRATSHSVQDSLC